MNGEDYEAAKDEHRPDWPGYNPNDCTLAYNKGYAAGVQAARDAVAALIATDTLDMSFREVDAILAAIDALRGES